MGEKGVNVKLLKPIAVVILSSMAPFGAADTIVDLTTAGSSGYIDGVNGGGQTARAWFVQTDPQPTGTGVFQPFVRIDIAGAGSESGFNTDGRPVDLDTKDENQWTHSIRLADDVAVISYKGQQYYEFLLDINEAGNQSARKLSLNQIELYISENTGSINTYAALQSDATRVFSMDTLTSDNRVELNYKLNHGSGSGDMFFYVPTSVFAGHANPYVYLYSSFGVPNSADAGFEEWSSKKGMGVAVPLPSTALGGLSLLGLIAGKFGLRRRTA